MRTLEQLLPVMERIYYPGFEFLLKNLDNHHIYLQVQCTEGTCNVTGEPITWRGRKWMVSKHVTDGELVQTAFLALLTALEHEAREKFKYKGMSILDPHYNPDLLLLLRKRPDAIVERKV